jgi:hypothetical protein
MEGSHPGLHYQFFAIDERDKSVYSSKVIFLDLPRIRDFAASPEVAEIVSWMVWFLSIVVAVSPLGNPVPQSIIPQGEFLPLRDTQTLQELRSCCVVES